MLQSSITCAYILDQNGAGKKITSNEVPDAIAEEKLLWLHFDKCTKENAELLIQFSGIDPIIAQALFSEDTRPRFNPTGNMGALLILKGLNLHPKAQPEDMISIRIWVEKNRVFSVSRYRMAVISEVEKRVELGQGFKTSDEFVAAVSLLLLDRIEPLIDEVDSTMDAIEQNFQDYDENLFSSISDIRVSTTTIKRYLSPQKEALGQFVGWQAEWLSKKQKKLIKEQLERISRFIEDLELVRERAGIEMDEIRNRMQRQMNKSMYIFSLVAVLFLPLTFLTGLFGINVGGIPGSQTPWGFAIFCLLLGAFTTSLLYIFRKLHWL